MKKICIVYANCQNELVAELLSKSPSFKEEYVIHRISVHLLMRCNSSINDDLLSRTKLFIYQPVKDIHGICSTNYILDKLPEDCQCISFPPLYFTGYFPQFCKNPNNRVVKHLYPFGIIPQGDTNIISMLKQNLSIAEITDRITDIDFYQREYLLNNVNNGINELARREASLSIKVSSFIKENYQNYRLFYTHNHPTDNLGIYVVNQILKAVNLPELESEKLDPNPKYGVLDRVQIPIYPSVIKHLKLNFASEIAFYKHKCFCTNKLTMDRYIREYVDIQVCAADSATDSYIKGIEYTQQNQLLLAEKSFQQAIKINKNNAVYYRELATVYQQQGKLNHAESVYKKAIETSPDWVDFYKSLGNILIVKSDFVGAASIYKQAIKLAPKDEELYSSLGYTLLNLERLDLAEQCYLHAIQLNPGKVRNYRCLGDIYKQQNYLDRAIAYYEKAIAIAPKNPWLYIHLSEALSEQNKIEEASKACKQSLKFNKGRKAGFYRRVGDLQLKIGSVDDALNTYQKAIEINPHYTEKIFARIGSKMKESAIA